MKKKKQTNYPLFGYQNIIPASFGFIGPCCGSKREDDFYVHAIYVILLYLEVGAEYLFGLNRISINYNKGSR